MRASSAEVSARYYAKHREKCLEYAREYRKRRKPWLLEHTKAHLREWRAANRNKVAAYQRRWAEKNRPSQSRVARTAVHDPCGYSSVVPKKRVAEIKRKNLAKIKAIAQKLRGVGLAENTPRLNPMSYSHP